MKELHEILLKTGNPFVWIKDNGWYFNEQPDSVMFTAQEVLSVNSFEQLFVEKTAQVINENLHNTDSELSNGFNPSQVLALEEKETKKRTRKK